MRDVRYLHRISFTMVLAKIGTMCLKTLVGYLRNNGEMIKYRSNVCVPLEVSKSKNIRPDFFLLVDLREFFFRFRVGGTKKN